MSKIWVITHGARNGPDDEFVMIGYSVSQADADSQIKTLNADDPDSDYVYRHETLERLTPTTK